MSGFIGPSHHLPGDTIGFAADGRSCDDEHCNDAARHAVIGESDSMGSEINYLCSKHFLESKEQIKEKEKEVTVCELCHEYRTGCQPFRDPNEGTSGRVYDACPECRKNTIDTFAGIEEEDDPYIPIDIDDDFEIDGDN